MDTAGHTKPSPRPATYTLEVHVQGGGKVELEVEPAAKIAAVIRQVLQAAGVVEQPGDRWDLMYRGEVLRPEDAVGAVAEREPSRPRKLEMRLVKQYAAGWR